MRGNRLLLIGFFLFGSIVGVMIRSCMVRQEMTSISSSNLQTIITLDHYQGTFSSAINEIAKECNLNSAVSHELADKQVEFDIHNQSAEFVLNNICLEFKCTWEVEDGSINVYKEGE